MSEGQNRAGHDAVGESGALDEGGRESQSPNPEHPATLGRREMLKVMTAVPAAALVPASAAARQSGRTASIAPAPEAQTAATTYQRTVLNTHERKTVSVLADYIIPADHRSGSATDAGVPAFIDDWLDFKGGLALDGIRGGMTWLDIESNRAFARDFVDCAEPQQKQMLDRIAHPKTASPEDAAGVAFFNQLRDLVVTGFFSSEMGVKDLPYLGNQMVAEWKGCPENVLRKLKV